MALDGPRAPERGRRGLRANPAERDLLLRLVGLGGAPAEGREGAQLREQRRGRLLRRRRRGPRRRLRRRLAREGGSLDLGGELRGVLAVRLEDRDLVPVVDNVGRDEREHQRDDEERDELERRHLGREADERRRRAAQARRQLLGRRDVEVEVEARHEQLEQQHVEEGPLAKGVEEEEEGAAPVRVQHARRRPEGEERERHLDVRPGARHAAHEDRQRRRARRPDLEHRVGHGDVEAVDDGQRVAGDGDVDEEVAQRAVALRVDKHGHDGDADRRHEQRLPQRLLAREREARGDVVVGRGALPRPARAVVPDDASRDEHRRAVDAEQDANLDESVVLRRLGLARRERAGARLVRLDEGPVDEVVAQVEPVGEQGRHQPVHPPRRHGCRERLPPRVHLELEKRVGPVGNLEPRRRQEPRGREGERGARERRVGSLGAREGLQQLDVEVELQPHRREREGDVVLVPLAPFAAEAVAVREAAELHARHKGDAQRLLGRAEPDGAAQRGWLGAVSREQLQLGELVQVLQPRLRHLDCDGPEPRAVERDGDGAVHRHVAQPERLEERVDEPRRQLRLCELHERRAAPLDGRGWRRRRLGRRRRRRRRCRKRASRPIGQEELVEGQAAGVRAGKHDRGGARRRLVLVEDGHRLDADVSERLLLEGDARALVLGGGREMMHKEEGRLRWVGHVEAEGERVCAGHRHGDHAAARHAHSEPLLYAWPVLPRALIHRLAQRARAGLAVAAVVACVAVQRGRRQRVLLRDVLLAAGGGVAVRNTVHERVVVILLAVVRPREGLAALLLEERARIPDERQVRRAVDGHGARPGPDSPLPDRLLWVRVVDGGGADREAHARPAKVADRSRDLGEVCAAARRGELLEVWVELGPSARHVDEQLFELFGGLDLAVLEIRAAARRHQVRLSIDLEGLDGAGRAQRAELWHVLQLACVVAHRVKPPRATACPPILRAERACRG
mmetsp:Transcript_2666/g.8697  ORF Transcript_2666/g.8697 Transcript_2666/m.8697 type:complete len:966 (-) Transcript_2666:1025-3922(-)